MRKCIATVCLSGTLTAKARCDLGCALRRDRGLRERPRSTSRASPTDLRNMAADRGLGIDLYQPFREFEGVSDEQFRRNLDRAERKFDIMEHARDVDDARVFADVSPQRDRRRCAGRRAAARAGGARRAAQHARRLRGARVGRRASTITTTRGRSSARRDHPHLGIILDSFHILSLGDDPAAIADIPGDKIFFLQMADAPLLSMDVLQWSRHYRNFPGQGQLDLPRFLEQVLRRRLHRPAVARDLQRHLPRGAEPSASPSMRCARCSTLEEQTRLRLEGSATDSSRPVNERARTVHRIELFDPPPAPTLTGVAFLEFAVDEATEWLLDNVLEHARIPSRGSAPLEERHAVPAGARSA